MLQRMHLIPTHHPPLLPCYGLLAACRWIRTRCMCNGRLAAARNPATAPTLDAARFSGSVAAVRAVALLSESRHGERTDTAGAGKCTCFVCACQVRPCVRAWCALAWAMGHVVCAKTMRLRVWVGHAHGALCAAVCVVLVEWILGWVRACFPCAPPALRARLRADRTGRLPRASVVAPVSNVNCSLPPTRCRATRLRARSQVFFSVFLLEQSVRVA